MQILRARVKKNSTEDVLTQDLSRAMQLSESDNYVMNCCSFNVYQDAMSATLPVRDGPSATYPGLTGAFDNLPRHQLYSHPLIGLDDSQDRN